MGMHGYAFTWERGRGKANWVEERLDQAVSSSSWSFLYRDAKLENINTVCSDHSAIFLDLNFKTRACTERLFIFENAWIKDEECSRLMIDFWSSVDGTPFPTQLSESCHRLKQWGDKKKNKHFGITIDELKSRLQRLKWK